MVMCVGGVIVCVCVRVCVHTDYTKGLSKEAITVLFKYLPRAYRNGANDLEARERVHSAATIAGESAHTHTHRHTRTQTHIQARAHAHACAHVRGLLGERWE